MRLFCEALWIQKRGNSSAEYEDAFWPKPSISGEDREQLSIAIADGATESSFSEMWAKKLVRAYCHGRIDVSNLIASLPELQQSWRQIVCRKPLPWYTEQKVQSGAFSTILGLTLRNGTENSDSGSWEAVAVGDSCLVQLRGDALISAFPLRTSTEFNNTPFLIGSRPNSNYELQLHVRTMNGTWEAGDSFYLMTDALAAWFFREVEQDAAPWRILRDLDNDQNLPFGPWIEEKRDQKVLRNDDVTLYRIETS